MKRRYKVLPLSFPFDRAFGYWEDCVEDKNLIQPVFNRNGFYCDRVTGRTWLEIDGKAWLYLTREGFQYELDVCEANNWLDSRLYAALGTLVSFGWATKKQRERWFIEEDRYRIKAASLEAKLGARRMRKRFDVWYAKHKKGEATDEEPTET